MFFNETNERLGDEGVIIEESAKNYILESEWIGRKEERIQTNWATSGNTPTLL